MPIPTAPHPSYACQLWTKVQSHLVDGFTAIYFTKFPQELEFHLHILPRPRCPILMAPRPSYAPQLRTKVPAHCMHAASSCDQLPICVYAASGCHQLPIDLRARSFHCRSICVHAAPIADRSACTQLPLPMSRTGGPQGMQAEWTRH